MGSTKCNYDWEAEADFEAVCRAKAVEKDPVRMEACKKMAKEKLTESKGKVAQHQTMVDMGEGKNP